MPLKKVHFKASSCEFPAFTDGLPRKAVAKNICTRIRLDRIHRMPKPPSWGEIAVTTIIAASIVCPVVASMSMAAGNSTQSTPLSQRNVTNQTLSRLRRFDVGIPWEPQYPDGMDPWEHIGGLVKKGGEKVGDFLLNNPDLLIGMGKGPRVPKIRLKPRVNIPPKPVKMEVKRSIPQGSNSNQPPPVKTPKQEIQTAMPNDKSCNLLGKVALAAAVAEGSKEVTSTIVSQAAKVEESLNETVHSIKRTILKEVEELRQEIVELRSSMEERLDSSVEGVANRTQESLGVLERSLTETVERAVVETSDTVSGIRSDLNETVSDVYDRIEQIVETIEHMLTSGGILRFSTTAIPVLISGVVIIQNCCASRREKKMLDTLKRIHGHMKRLNLQTSPV